MEKRRGRAASHRPTEKTVLAEIQEALYEIRGRQRVPEPACSARVRDAAELQESLQRSHWAFTPFAPNTANRYEPRPQGLSEANREAARQTNYVGQVLGIPIFADEATAPGMLCINDYAGSLVREIIIDQNSYDVWAKEQGYWRKADEAEKEVRGTSEAASSAGPREAAVYGLWRGSGWQTWASGELIASAHVRILRATLFNFERAAGFEKTKPIPSALEGCVIREILEDGSPGRIIPIKF